MGRGDSSRGDFVVSDDPQRLDLTAIHEYLNRSYWAEGIPVELVRRSLDASLSVGLYHQGRQIGLARVITDRATFAYLCDVYVLEEYQGQGLGQWMMQYVMAHPDLQGLRRFSLVTRSAHRLYQPLGFTPLAKPENHMEIVKVRMYQTGGTGKTGG